MDQQETKLEQIASFREASLEFEDLNVFLEAVNRYTNSDEYISYEIQLTTDWDTDTQSYTGSIKLYGRRPLTPAELRKKELSDKLQEEREEKRRRGQYEYLKSIYEGDQKNGN